MTMGESTLMRAVEVAEGDQQTADASRRTAKRLDENDVTRGMQQHVNVEDMETQDPNEVTMEGRCSSRAHCECV